MRSIILLLTLAISNSFGAPVAPTVIFPPLPFTVTHPGTYVLASDLTYTNTNPANGVTAIIVPTNLAGPVIIDFKGHTLTGPGTVSVGVGIGFYAGSPNTTNLGITVRNGTIKNFTRGVNAIVGGVYLSNINVNHVSFFTAVIPGSNDDAGIIIDGCNDSSVTNCTFNVGDVGISDQFSQGGNHYSNDTFLNVFECLKIIGQGAIHAGESTVINRCDIAAPPL
jgi:hypothetical protein